MSITIGNYSVMSAADLGEMIPSKYTQIGALVTHYYRPSAEEDAPDMHIGTTTDTILHDTEGDLFAVSLHKGAAFLCAVGDPEIISTIRSHIAKSDAEEFDPAKGIVFKLEQNILLSQEELGEATDAEA